MKAAFVLDCSMTMSWCFPDETTAHSQRVQDRLEFESCVVPAHWYLEVSNVLAMAERRGRHTPEDSAKFLAVLLTLEIAADGEIHGRAFDHLLPICRAHKLSSYDAAYIDVALRHGLPLASLDAQLCAAAKKAGIAIFKPE